MNSVKRRGSTPIKGIKHTPQVSIAHTDRCAGQKTNNISIEKLNDSNSYIYYPKESQSVSKVESLRITPLEFNIQLMSLQKNILNLLSKYNLTTATSKSIKLLFEKFSQNTILPAKSNISSPTKYGKISSATLLLALSNVDDRFEKLTFFLDDLYSSNTKKILKSSPNSKISKSNVIGGTDKNLCIEKIKDRVIDAQAAYDYAQSEVKKLLDVILKLNTKISNIKPIIDKSGKLVSEQRFYNSQYARNGGLLENYKSPSYYKTTYETIKSAQNNIRENNEDLLLVEKELSEKFSQEQKTEIPYNKPEIIENDTQILKAEIETLRETVTLLEKKLKNSERVSNLMKFCYENISTLNAEGIYTNRIIELFKLFLELTEYKENIEKISDTKINEIFKQIKIESPKFIQENKNDDFYDEFAQLKIENDYLKNEVYKLSIVNEVKIKHEQELEKIIYDLKNIEIR